MNMKNLIAAVLMIQIVLPSAVFAAPKSAAQLPFTASEKQALVKHMQKQIARHENMTLGEIQADLREQLVKNREFVLKNKNLTSEDRAKVLKGFDVSERELLSVMDKEVLIHQEKTRLREANTSFFFTLLCQTFSGSCPASALLWTIPLDILLLPVYIVMLPFSLIASAIDG